MKHDVSGSSEHPYISLERERKLHKKTRAYSSPNRRAVQSISAHAQPSCSARVVEGRAACVCSEMAEASDTPPHLVVLRALQLIPVEIDAETRTAAHRFALKAGSVPIDRFLQDPEVEALLPQLRTEYVPVTHRSRFLFAAALIRFDISHLFFEKWIPAGICSIEELLMRSDDESRTFFAMDSEFIQGLSRIPISSTEQKLAHLFAEHKREQIAEEEDRVTKALRLSRELHAVVVRLEAQMAQDLQAAVVKLEAQIVEVRSCHSQDVQTTETKLSAELAAQKLEFTRLRTGMVCLF